MKSGELPAKAFLHVTSAVFRARRLAARVEQIVRPDTHVAPARDAVRGDGTRRRNILFVTVDQQRYDALGVNGGVVARTPVIDALARQGINFSRAHVHNVVCMPSRSTMLTGQYPRTHGVIANGIPLPANAPSVAEHLRSEGGYRTALIGKAHFEPHLDPWLSYPENQLAARGPRTWRGFEHVELATHGPLGGHHYAVWLRSRHPRSIHGFGGVLTGAGGGDTGAPEVAHNHIAREQYHTDWIADRTSAYLRRLPRDRPFFCWMSFPDPHHPYDPPYDEVKKRIAWRDVPLPAGHPGSRDAADALHARRPAHWRAYFRGTFRNPEGGPTSVVPGRLTDDHLREINAMIHVENELIDEALGRVLATLRELGREADTDIVFTSDHGELQGDHGLVFKGPYHVDALLRVPMIWRPAPVANIPAADVRAPVGNVALAPTFCAIAGLPVPSWMDGAPLPASESAAVASKHERVISTFDSQFAPVGMHLRTIYRDGHLCTTYERSTTGEGGHFPLYWAVWGRNSTIPRYDGTEGELYACDDDPHQQQNLWSDPARRRLRDELVADLRDHLPPLVRRLRVESPT